MDGIRSRVHYTQGHAAGAAKHQSDVRCPRQAGRSQAHPFSDLRHSCATLLFAQGVDLQTIQDLLGHSSIGVTSAIYVDVLREIQRDAIDRLGHPFGPDDETDT
ncbi:MAG TPA: tyrosine-type recombinase/integrase [Pseudonocardiaceae bacterium]